MSAPKGKRAGRPPQLSLAQTSARSTFTVRMRGAVRAALIEASEKSGRSISEELETRLDRSFDLEAEFGGAASFRLLLTYARALQGIEAAEGARWYDDSDKGRVVMARAVPALGAAMMWETTWMEPVGDEEAGRLLGALNDPPDPVPTRPDSSGIVHEDVGPDEPDYRLVGQEEATRRMTGLSPAIRNRPRELFERADFDEATSGLPSDRAGRADREPSTAPKKPRKAEAKSTT